MEIRDVLTNIKKYDAWDYKNYPLRKEEADAIMENYKEPCADCISREYILSKAHECRDDLADDEPCCVDADDIREAPSVYPKAKVGHWKRISADKYVQHATYYYICSECEKDIIGEHNYCPNCGAKMESEDKE